MNEYIEVVAKDFHILSFRKIHDIPELSKDMCTDEVPGVDFEWFPMDRNLNDSELAEFVKLISNMKYCGRVYQKAGIAQKVRLTTVYQHANTKQFHEKGTECIL